MIKSWHEMATLTIEEGSLYIELLKLDQLTRSSMKKLKQLWT